MPSTSKELRSQLHRSWRLKNPEKVKAEKQRYYQKHKEKINAKLRVYAKQHSKEIREEVVQHYSNGTMCCANCGESFFDCLTMDHINNDGHLQRKNRTYGSIYYWLKKNGFPSGFQVLCFNCNSMKTHRPEGFVQLSLLRKM